MHRIHTTEAFVLTSGSRGEGSSYARFYTRELGLLSAWVQGVRVMKSKLRAHVQPFSWVELSLVRGRDMWRVTGSQQLDRLVAPLEDAEQFRFVTKIFALLSRLVAGEEPDHELFDEIKKALTVQLPMIPQESLGEFEVLLVLRVLFRLGYLESTADAEKLLSFDSSDLSRYADIRSLRPQAVSLINSALRASQL